MMKLFSKIILPLKAALPLLAVALLVFAGCSDVFAPPVVESNPETGGLKISVSNDMDGSRSTLVPNVSSGFNFDYYNLYFTSDDAVYTDGEFDLEEWDGKPLVVELPNGTWTVTVEGYVEIGGTDYLAAVGSEMTVIDYSEDAYPEIEITISATQEGGNGVFAYKVAYSGTKIFETAKLEISPFGWAGTPENVVFSTFPAEGTIALAPGFYLMTITLETDYQIVTRMAIVHIYSGLETLADFTFTDNDFTNVITLSGTATLDGEPVPAGAGYYIDVHTNASRSTAYLLGQPTVGAGGTWSIDKIAAFETATALYFGLYNADGEQAVLTRALATYTANTIIDLEFVSGTTSTDPVVTFNYNTTGTRLVLANPGITAQGVQVSSGTVGADMPVTTGLLDATNGWNAGMSVASWNTAINGSGTTFTAATEVTGDINVYAQWVYNAGTLDADGVVIAPLLTTSQSEPGSQGTWSAGNTYNTDGSLTFVTAGNYSGGAARYWFPAGIEDYDFVTLDFVVEGDLTALFKQGTGGEDYTPMSGSFVARSVRFAIKVAGYNSAIALQREYNTGTIKFTKATFEIGSRYNITLDVNGGNTLTESTITGVVAGVAIGNILPTPTRSGYDFIGWYAGDVAYSAGTTMPGNALTLVARWAEHVVATPITVDFTGMTFNTTNATAVVLADGSGYTETKSQGYDYAVVSFNITLPTGISLSDYDTVSFGILGSGDDPNYKPVGVFAADPALQNQTGGLPGDGQRFSTDPFVASSPYKSLQIAGNMDGNGNTYNSGQVTWSYPIVKANADLRGTVQICIFARSNTNTSYTITNFQIYQDDNPPASEPFVEVLNDFTWVNAGNANQVGWNFTASNWGTFAKAKYLVIESSGSNDAYTFGGLTIIINANGWTQTEVNGDYTNFTNANSGPVYLVIQLDTLEGYNTTVAATGGQFALAYYPIENLGFTNAYLTDKDFGTPSDAVNLSNGGTTYGFITKNITLD